MKTALMKAWLLAYVLFAAGGWRGEGPIIGEPNPYPTTWKYKFDGDLVNEIDSVDGTGDQINSWTHYQAGVATLSEQDTDGDGKPDMRWRFELPKNWKPYYHVMYLEGRYRIVPAIGPVSPKLRIEKLVDGNWTGNFEMDLADKGSIDLPESHRCDVRPLHVKFVDGVQKEALANVPGHYYHYLLGGDGVGRDETGSDAKTIQWTNELKGDQDWVSTTFDEKGAPTQRSIYKDGKSREERFRDGKWTGDFEQESIDGLGGRVEIKFRDGVVADEKTYRENERDLKLHIVHAPDGSKVQESVTQDGPTSRKIVTAKKESIYERQVDGKWTRNFTVSSNGSTREFSEGRLVRQVFDKNEVKPGQCATVTFPTPDVEEFWIGEQVVMRRKYEIRPETMDRLTYEERDTDGDGKMDMICDLEKMTITQPEQPVEMKVSVPETWRHGGPERRRPDDRGHRVIPR